MRSFPRLNRPKRQNAIGFLSSRRTATNWPEWFIGVNPDHVEYRADRRRNGGILPSRVSSSSASLDASRSAFLVAALLVPELQILVLALESRVVAVGFLDVVVLVEALRARAATNPARPSP